MSNVIFKPVVGWPYSIGSDGSVRRETKVNGTYAGRVLKPFKDSSGYAQVTLYGHDGSRWDALVHRLMSIYHLNWFGEINHDDGKKWNNTLPNLKPTFHDAQMTHAKALGLIASKANGRWRMRGTAGT